MGGQRRVRSEESGSRQNLAQEDLNNLLLSFQNAFQGGGQGQGLGYESIAPILGTELQLQQQFGARFQEQQQAAIQRDPILSRLSQTAQRGLDSILSGIASGNNLPSDVRQNLLQEIRGSQAARGVLESPRAGLEEAVRLSGGREAFRAARLAQAAPFISAGLNLGSQGRDFSVLGQFAPGPSEMLQGNLQSRNLAFQSASMNANLGAQADAARGQLIGTGIGLAGTVATGGLLGGVGGAGFGAGAMGGLGQFFGFPAGFGQTVT